MLFSTNENSFSIKLFSSPYTLSMDHKAQDIVGTQYMYITSIVEGIND
jgi:hypothetical protein